MTADLARRLFGLVEPIAVVTYLEPEPTEEVMALGLRDPWDAYFAGRAAALGADVPAAVVDALFYGFAPGEVARHVPRVWDVVTPEDAETARRRGSVAALRRALGDLADGPDVGPTADLLLRVAASAPVEGRGLFAAVRALPVPTEPLARLWHGANLLREHRGDGHVAALVVEGIGRTEAHVLHALAEGIPAGRFGRLGHLPDQQLAAVVDGMRTRGLVGADGWLTAEGRRVKGRVEALTDRLAAAAYAALAPDEVDRLVAGLVPLAVALDAARPQEASRRDPPPAPSRP